MKPNYTQERTLAVSGIDRKYPMREYVIEMPCPICGNVIAHMFELDGYQKFHKHYVRDLEHNFCLDYGKHMLSHYDKIKNTPKPKYTNTPNKRLLFSLETAAEPFNLFNEIVAKCKEKAKAEIRIKKAKALQKQIDDLLETDTGA